MITMCRSDFVELLVLVSGGLACFGAGWECCGMWIDHCLRRKERW